MFRSILSLGSVLVLALTVCLLVTPNMSAQSTASITGTVTDATGAVIPNATVTVRNEATGEERTTQTDSAGLYVVPSLPAGTYRVEVKSTGMQTMAAPDLVVPVSTTVRQDFSLQVGATTQTVEITAAAPVIQGSTISVGSVVNQATVQEIPLNGRHFIDLTLLTAGTVTPPANGFLTTPLRGQGSFGFNSGGAREDEVNYMINGVNLSDPVQNQITFQPTINTVSEFKLDNSTYNAEYGRNAGSIVNIATRSGTNEWHGDFYEYLRNSYFDARNFTNPTSVHQSPFNRNQFGADGGGAIKKDKTFFFLSYEGLRQLQSVPLTSGVLTAAQHSQALATGDPIIRQLANLIPLPNSGTNQFVSGATANVNIDQGTANVSHNLTDSNRLNFYYAYQADLRGEPPTTDGNTLPGYGDIRQGHRQIFTLNDIEVVNPNVVNEARLGYNRIHITFNADDTTNASALGISSGSTTVGLPQISIPSLNLGFGGVGGFPQGRGDYSAVASDTISWTHGKHNIKFGGEYRRIDNNNFSYTPGTFSFPSVNAFIADQANSFTANPSNGASRIFVNSIGGFAMDEWKMTRSFMLTLGLRYDWYGTPTEGGGRFVTFDPSNSTLQHANQPYQQSALNFQPRLGFAWDPFKNGKTVIRSAYAIMTDQPITGIVTALANNPPNTFPVNFSPTTAVPFVSLSNAFSNAVAGGVVAPRSITPDYKDAYVQSYNFNVQQQFGNSWGVMAGYFGSKGTNLNIIVNQNQPINGAKPYPVLSAASPIFAGKALSSILTEESVANSNYNALWLTVTKQLSHGLQINGSYTWSKSMDDDSLTNNAGFLPQNSYDIRNEWGPSNFNVTNRVALAPIYMLPFKGNRFVEGWHVSAVVQLQTGNPLNIHTTNALFTGLATLRPSITGPVETGFTPARNRSATSVTYIQNPGVFYDQGNAFGNLGRNAITGPGFWNIDLNLMKETHLTERLLWTIRADCFDLMNHANFNNPNLLVPGSQTFGAPVPTSVFGLITAGTRFPAGDFGTSRQVQFSTQFTF